MDMEHPALVYASQEDLLGYLVPYVRAGLDRDEVVFIAARGDNLAALRAEIGPSAARWADTDAWHPHPATRLRAFHEMVTGALANGATRFQLAGEPVWPDGPPELVREWQRYESVLNSVLAPFPASLVCLYDGARLAPSILETARRTHPRVCRGSSEYPSDGYQDPEVFVERWNPEPPPPPAWAARLAEPPELAAARRFIREQALGQGLPPVRADELCLAGNEALTNALVHGGGIAALWTWREDGRFICQIEDRGPGIRDPLAGYRPPAHGMDSGHGLWLARQLVDLLQIVPGREGTTVRLHVSMH